MNASAKRLLSVLCTVILLVGMVTPAASALGAEAPELPENAPVVLSCTEIPLYSDGVFIGNGIMLDTITYVPLRTFVETMLEEPCEVTWDQDTGTAVLSAADLLITLTLDDGYMTANGRYIYLKDRVYNINGTIIVPIRELARIFNAEIFWNTGDWSISIDTSDFRLLESGENFYPEEDLYWLSHVIYSEAGNQPLEGMIGVGNVVLNRAADDSGLFGEGIYGVIFLPGQFDVVAAGSIYLQPSEKAVAAAKLSLEGYNTVGDAKWFVNPAIGATGWFRTYKTFALTIADHDFYT